MDSTKHNRSINNSNRDFGTDLEIPIRKNTKALANPKTKVKLKEELIEKKVRLRKNFKEYPKSLKIKLSVCKKSC